MNNAEPIRAARRAFLAATWLAMTACQREERRFSESASFAGERYGSNAWAMSEGQRLYAQMNCAGCHAHGGGALGVPLMDSKWRYGSEPRRVFESILQGRPNG